MRLKILVLAVCAVAFVAAGCGGGSTDAGQVAVSPIEERQAAMADLRDESERWTTCGRRAERASENAIWVEDKTAERDAEATLQRCLAKARSVVTQMEGLVEEERGRIADERAAANR